MSVSQVDYVAGKKNINVLVSSNWQSFDITYDRPLSDGPTRSISITLDVGAIQLTDLYEKINTTVVNPTTNGFTVKISNPKKDYFNVTPKIIYWVSVPTTNVPGRPIPGITAGTQKLSVSYPYLPFNVKIEGFDNPIVILSNPTIDGALLVKLEVDKKEFKVEIGYDFKNTPPPGARFSVSYMVYETNNK